MTPGSPGPGNVVLMFSQHPGICCRDPGTDPGSRAFSRSCPSVRPETGHGPGGGGRWLGSASFGSSVGAPRHRGAFPERDDGECARSPGSPRFPRFDAAFSHQNCLQSKFSLNSTRPGGLWGTRHSIRLAFPKRARLCWSKASREARGSAGPDALNAGLPCGDSHGATAGSSCAPAPHERLQEERSAARGFVCPLGGLGLGNMILEHSLVYASIH